MKIIFEYEDGTYRIVPLLKVHSIEERNYKNCLIDEYIAQPDVVNKYIIANDNRLAGFGEHKDVLKVRKSIEGLKKTVALQEKVLEHYKSLEDLSVQNEKMPIDVNVMAVDELFAYAIERGKHVLHTSKPN